MKKGMAFLSILILPLLLLLGGCGGGGEGGAPAATVSGVAAAGAPLVGMVKLKDASSPAKELTATIAEDGSFSFDVSGVTPPFILKATGTVGITTYTLHSFANGAGTANVNPLANLAVAMASGGLDPATVYASPSAGILQAIAAKLSASVTDLQTQLQPLLALYDAAKSNPITDTFSANHTGLDEVLDMVKVEVTGGTVTVKDKKTSGVIIAGQPNDPGKWTTDPTKIPVPQVHPVISPHFAKVEINQTVNFAADVKRSTDKKVTWSVVETDGGTISDAGVYTAPATDGTYHVKAVSAANPDWPVTATVKVIPKSVDIKIEPESATVSAGGSKTFTATVTGTSNTKVTWSVVEADGGSITSAGVYTAPATAGKYHVKATSVADPNKSKTVEVTVSTTQQPPDTSPSGSFPIGTWVGPNGFSFTIEKPGQALSVQHYAGSISYSGFSQGKITTSGNAVPDTLNGGSIFGTSNIVSLVGTDPGNMTYFEAQLTQNDTNPNKLEGYLIVIPVVGATINDSKAVFTKQ